MKFYYKDGSWHPHPAPKTYSIYAKINGALAKWQDECVHWQTAMKSVRKEIGQHRGAVLVVIK